MRQIVPFTLWLGHVGDIRDWRVVFDAGIQAIIDLAGNEPPASPPRELVYCRFPLIDGAGNEPRLLEAAVTTLEHFLRHSIPVLVYCSAGLSRSTAVTAAALARTTEQPLDDCLVVVQQTGSVDVPPGLWASLQDDFAT